MTSLYLTKVSFLSSFSTSTAARKRLVAPIPWGGEEEAQEEASRSESQLLLYGCEMSRYSNDMNAFVTVNVILLGRRKMMQDMMPGL